MMADRGGVKIPAIRIKTKIKIRITVRFVKLCASEGESPSRLAGQTAGIQS